MSTETVFLPGRAYRRSVAGQKCPACNVRMHHLDVVALRGETDVTPLHIQCATAIAERAGTETEETDETL